VQVVALTTALIAAVAGEGAVWGLNEQWGGMVNRPPYCFYTCPTIHSQPCCVKAGSGLTYRVTLLRFAMGLKAVGAR